MGNPVKLPNRQRQGWRQRRNHEISKSKTERHPGRARGCGAHSDTGRRLGRSQDEGLAALGSGRSSHAQLGLAAFFDKKQKGGLTYTSAGRIITTSTTETGEKEKKITAVINTGNSEITVTKFCPHVPAGGDFFSGRFQDENGCVQDASGDVVEVLVVKEDWE